MASNRNTNYRKGNSQNKFSPSKLLTPKVYTNLPNNKKANDGNKESQNEKDNAYVKYGTWSDRIGVFVNFVMVVFTLLLFNQAVRQNSISEKNIALADSVFNLSKIAFESSIESERDANRRANEEFALQNRLVNSQVQSFKDDRDRFIDEMDADIKIDNDFYQSGIIFKVGNQISKEFKIVNLGQNKISIESIQTALEIRSDTPTLKDINKIPVNRFEGTISPSSPFSINIKSKFKLTELDSLWVDYYKIQDIYIYGRITFRNDVIKKRKDYNFILKTLSYGSFQYINVKN